MAHRLGDERQRGEMQNAVEPLLHRSAQIVCIEEVGNHESGAGRDRLAMTLLEVVEHHDLVLGRQ